MEVGLFSTAKAPCLCQDQGWIKVPPPGVGLSHVFTLGLSSTRLNACFSCHGYSQHLGFYYSCGIKVFVILFVTSTSYMKGYNILYKVS